MASFPYLNQILNSIHCYGGDDALYDDILSENLLKIALEDYTRAESRVVKTWCSISK